MIKFFRENLFGCSVAIVLIVIGLTDFCLNKLNSYGVTRQQTVLTSNSLDSKPIDVNNQSPSSKNKIIEIKGEDIGSSFHSLDFIDEQNGWIIENKYAAPEEPSKILRTQDGGIHWEKTEFKDMLIDKLSFINKSVGFAIAKASSESKSDTKLGTLRILQTQDGGKSWTIQWEKKMPSTTSNDLWFQDALSGYALIGGVLLSTGDGGKHWSSVNFGVVDFIPQHMSFTSMEKGWVIGIKQIKNQSNEQTSDNAFRLMVLQTFDVGKHWHKQFEKNYIDGSVSGIDIDFITPSTGWFLISDFATLRGELYYTSNGGMNWKKINEIRSARPTPTEVRFVTPEIGWIPLDVGAGPIAGGLMYTKDGGKNFSVIGGEDELGISSVREVYFTSEQQGWAICMSINHGAYIIHTTDGGKTWTQIYPRLTPIEDISFVDNEHGFGLGQLMDSRALLATMNGGKDWKNIYSFPKTFYPSFISFTDREHGFVLGTAEENKASLYKTSDGGKNWTRIDDKVFQIEGFSVIYFRFFDLNKGILTTRSANNISFYSTMDGGRSWQLSSITPAKDVNALSFTSINTGWNVYTSRQDIYSLNLSQIVNSKTGQSLGAISSNMWPYSIEFLSKDNGWILVQQPPFKEDSVMKLLYTSDEGKTWSTLQFPKEFKIDSLRNQFPFQFTDENHGWLLSSCGLLSTEDGGNTWNWIN